jgi:outer membrane protein OmpA-like peptidoglycan-associated protein
MPVAPAHGYEREGEPLIISAGFTIQGGCGQGQYAGGGRIGRNGSVEYDIGVPTFMNTSTRQFGVVRGARYDDGKWSGKEGGCGMQQVSTTAERFTLGADALFAFDRSTMADVLPGGRAALDELAARLMSVYQSVVSITVTGHTDRLGSDAYNQALSLARARTIRDYLAMRGLPAEAMVVAGEGKTHPVTKDCPAGHSAVVIQCLQPDRRVTIDIVGEKREGGELRQSPGQLKAMEPMQAMELAQMQ